MTYDEPMPWVQERDKQQQQPQPANKQGINNV